MVRPRHGGEPAESMERFLFAFQQLTSPFLQEPNAFWKGEEDVSVDIDVFNG